jgi:3'(2'), 5'-bisphosphate nucleotidase/myo-inositol-1(or 4)-monophosphatase
VFDQDQLNELVTGAMAAAREAGAYISSQAEAMQQGEIAREHKAAGGTPASEVVTVVDRTAQDMILAALAPLTEQYSLAVLAEEAADSGERLQREAFWAIDPLDGTLFFVKGMPGYSVVISLVTRNGTPLIGVIYDITEGVMYHAVKGGGAFRNGVPWHVEVPSAHAGELACYFDRSFLHAPEHQRTLELVQEFAVSHGLHTHRICFRGGGAVSAMTAADTAPACYFKYPKVTPGGGSIWDFAASACIFNELGLPVGDFTGGALRLNNPHTTYMHERGVVYATDQELFTGILALYENNFSHTE